MPNLTQTDTRPETESKIECYLKSIKINVPANKFIEILSNIYHAHESAIYDKRQISLNDSVKYWQEAFSIIAKDKIDNISILDYGAGTGFAINQLLSSVLKNNIHKITAYDLSNDMINICKQNLKDKYNKNITFLSGESGAMELLIQSKFDLVITNSLLHHIYDLKSFFNQLKQFIKPGGYYIAGHEPNQLFYLNDELVKETKKYIKYKRIITRFSWPYLKEKLGFQNSINLAYLTNSSLIDKKIINKKLPDSVIYKLIDIHVPIGFSRNQMWGELGFNPKLMIKNYLGLDFELVVFFTYSHIKDGKASSDYFYKKIVSKLESKYPEEGADCLMIFRRKI